MIYKSEISSNIRIENLTEKKTKTPSLKCYSKCQSLDLSVLVASATGDIQWLHNVHDI